MPVISISTPKGGAGKTTAVMLLATELAERGARVTIIDADPNKNVLDWSKLPGKPDNITVIDDVTEETIADVIEEAAVKTAFVVVDLEGTASLMVSYAIAMSDFVLIPMQGSQLDAKQAARQMKLINAQERIARRPIPFAVLFTKGNQALQPKTQRHLEELLIEQKVPIMATRLYDREPFRAMFSYGGSLSSLKDKGMSNLPSAIKNARDFAAEVVDRLRNGNQTAVDDKEVA